MSTVDTLQPHRTLYRLPFTATQRFYILFSAMHIIGISVPLCCLLWHFIVTIITLVDYIVYVRRSNRLSQTVINTHLAFSIIGLAAYGLAAAPLFVDGYKYGKSKKERTNRLLAGMAVMLVMSSFPMVVVELIVFITFSFPMSLPLRAIVFVLHALGCIVGGSVTWMAYLRATAGFLHRLRGPERQITDDLEHDEFCAKPLVHLPSLSGQPDVI